MRKVFFLFVILTMNSCLYDDMYFFTSDDKLWFEIYNSNDTFCYRNGDEIDKLIINDKIICDTSSRWIRGENEMFEDFNAWAEFEGYFIHKNKKNNVYYRVSKCGDSIDLSISVVFGNRSAFGINDKRNRIGKCYKDTIIIDDYNSVLSISNAEDTIPFNFEWIKISKKKGIVAYKLTDGTGYAQ